MPDSVRATRRRHPFEGQTLAVLGGMCRHGVLELLVVLADGSKTLILSDWTNAATAAASAEAGTLGSLRDLLRAVAVAAALLPASVTGRVESGGQSREEAADVHPGSTRPGSAGLAAPPPRVLEGLSDHDHAVAVRVLARLMVKMIAPELAGEQVAGGE